MNRDLFFSKDYLKAKKWLEHKLFHLKVIDWPKRVSLNLKLSLESVDRKTDLSTKVVGKHVGFCDVKDCLS